METPEEKGEWAETAEEGVVPDELGADDDAAVLGRTTGSDEPATEEGVDLDAGDQADATERRRRRAAGGRRARPQGRHGRPPAPGGRHVGQPVFRHGWAV